MERLKALLAVALFIAAVLFADPVKNNGRIDLTGGSFKTSHTMVNDTTTNSIYNYRPEQPPEMH